ncbi:MAG TPA: FadR/GntR family transcriptional regulator [Pseudolysinimonas sp.]|nr:FadR/GntR family transcriptional regulator [Pseudolysinimonas sp.]
MLTKDFGAPYLGTQLADQLVEHIREHGLKDGDPLPSEQEIARTYGASMRVVRDALRMLSQLGVIRTQQGRRSEVANLPPVAVRQYFKLLVDSPDGGLGDLLEFRRMLEGASAALAATRISERKLAELEGLLARIEGAAQPVTRSELDVEFHSAVARAAGNSFVSATVDALFDALTIEREQGLAATESTGGSHATSDTEHRAILDALAAHDGEAAQRLMTAHLDRVRASVDASRKS